MNKLVIFDMDGLIFDTETDYYNAINFYFKEHDFPLISKEDYSICCGKGDQVYFDMIDRHCHKKMDGYSIIDYVENLRKQWMDTRGVIKKKGIDELLQYLKSKDYKIVIGSSTAKPMVVKLLKMANIYQYFDEFVCGDMVSHKKPDPEIFIKACESVNIDCKDALVLEDATAGIEAAYRANIDVICIPDLIYPPSPYKEMCSAILDDLTCVIEYLENNYND